MPRTFLTPDIFFFFTKQKYIKPPTVGPDLASNAIRYVSTPFPHCLILSRGAKLKFSPKTSCGKVAGEGERERALKLWSVPYSWNIKQGVFPIEI
jgi:hypothetical protein